MGRRKSCGRRLHLGGLAQPRDGLPDDARDVHLRDADDPEQRVVALVQLRGRNFLPVLAREVSLPLTDDVRRCFVRVSVYNRMRQRSPVAEVATR